MSKIPRKIVLTGASRGIGYETAKLLLPKGVKILGISRNLNKIMEVLPELEALGEIAFLEGDVSNPDVAKNVAEWVDKNWGSLDCLINNAGIQVYQPSFLAEDRDVLEKTMKINVFGPHYLIKALIPLLKKGTEPRIINVASGAGTIEAVYNSEDMPSYGLSKFALNGVTAMYSKVLEGEIAVNSLDPGWLKTDLGGPQAPGEPIDGAHRIIELLKKPFSETGKFWHGKEPIDF